MSHTFGIFKSSVDFNTCMYKKISFLVYINLYMLHQLLVQIKSTMIRSILHIIILHKYFTDYQHFIECDQSILIETSSWNQRIFSEPPQLIRDSHYMVVLKPFYIVFPPCKVSNPTDRSYFHNKVVGVFTHRLPWFERIFQKVCGIEVICMF